MRTKNGHPTTVSETTPPPLIDDDVAEEEASKKRGKKRYSRNEDAIVVTKKRRAVKKPNIDGKNDEGEAESEDESGSQVATTTVGRRNRTVELEGLRPERGANGELVFSCSMCTRCFYSAPSNPTPRAALTKHEKAVHGAQLFVDNSRPRKTRCMDCRIGFISEALRLAHICETGSFECPEPGCGIKLLKMLMRRHTEEVHGNYDNEYKRNKTTTKEEDKDGEKGADVIEDVDSILASIEEDEDGHRKPDFNRDGYGFYHCAVCSRPYERLETTYIGAPWHMLKHERIAHGASLFNNKELPASHKCNLCKCGFVSISDYQRHLEKSDSCCGKQTMVCDIDGCGSRFTPEAMRKHWNIVHGVKMTIREVLDKAGRVKDKVGICNAMELIEPSKVLNVTQHSARPDRSEAHFDLLDQDRWKAIAHAQDWHIEITQAKVRQPDCKSRYLSLGRHLWEAEGFADDAGWEVFADHNSTDRQYMRYARTFTAALVLFGQRQLNDKAGWK
jgi:hypothetical protein